MQITETSAGSEDRLSPHQEDLLAQLFTACKISDVDSVDRILNSDLNPTDSTDSTSMDATNENLKRSELKKTLLCYPLDKNGDTLLHVASRGSNKIIIDLLLQHGSDPTIR